MCEMPLSFGVGQ